MRWKNPDGIYVAGKSETGTARSRSNYRES